MITGSNERRCGRAAGVVAAGIVAVALVVAPAGANALGSYDSKLETGSAIGLAVVGGVTFIPVAFALMDPPLTAQRITGKALVLAGSLTAIAFCVYYFASDDPLWVPHALGWGIGGGLILSGFIVWLTDDTPEETAPAAQAGAGTDATPLDGGDPEGAGSPPVPGEGRGAGEALPPVPLDRSGAPGYVSFAPLALPGGGGLLLAGAW
jgi:hypothetical protein